MDVTPHYRHSMVVPWGGAAPPQPHLMRGKACAHYSCTWIPHLGLARLLLLLLLLLLLRLLLLLLSPSRRLVVFVVVNAAVVALASSITLIDQTKGCDNENADERNDTAGWGGSIRCCIAGSLAPCRRSQPSNVEIGDAHVDELFLSGACRRIWLACGMRHAACPSNSATHAPEK